MLGSAFVCVCVCGLKGLKGLKGLSGSVKGFRLCNSGLRVPELSGSSLETLSVQKARV